MKHVKLQTSYEDERGKIIDIIENKIIEHITIISSKKDSIRGDHYHKESIQYNYILKGRLKLLTQMQGEKMQINILESGDLILNPPMERHALIALEDSEILVMTRGPRGGKNYEQDTFRLGVSESLIKGGNLNEKKDTGL